MSRKARADVCREREQLCLVVWSVCLGCAILLPWELVEMHIQGHFSDTLGWGPGPHTFCEHPGLLQYRWSPSHTVRRVGVGCEGVRVGGE